MLILRIALFWRTHKADIIAVSTTPAAQDFMTRRRPHCTTNRGYAVVDQLIFEFPNLKVLRFIDAGASGAVFEALDGALKRRCALKIWYKPIVNNSRALAEAQKLAQFSHPLLASVYSAGVMHGRLYSIMEFVDGPNLRSWLAQDGLKSPHRAAIWYLVYRAMGHIYQAGIVHGDPHAGNFVIVSDPRIIAQQQDLVLDKHSPNLGLDGLVRKERLALKALDIGASWSAGNSSRRKARESAVLLELADEIFSDFSPSHANIAVDKMPPKAALNWLNDFAGFYLYLSEMDLDQIVICMLENPVIELKELSLFLQNRDTDPLDIAYIYLGINHWLREGTFEGYPYKGELKEPLKSDVVAEIEETFHEHRFRENDESSSFPNRLSWLPALQGQQRRCILRPRDWNLVMRI